MRILLALCLLTIIVGAPLVYWSLASTETRNFRAVTPGVLYRSGQMTPDGLARVIDEYGLRTVISFRDAKDGATMSPDEFEERLCQLKKVTYHRLAPLRWSEPDGSVPAQANVDRFLAIMRDPATPRPILVHCFAGVHRTGAFVALYRMDREGWSNDEAVREMLTIGRLHGGFENDQIEYLAKFKPAKR